ncbi:ZKSC2 protein, partial [Corythaixoides concolor]|nr:ZKSC2 protein [Corythaixoides concolor]
ETFHWTVVQQIDSPSAARGRRGGKTAAGTGAFSNIKGIIVLQKSYECGECSKSFSRGSHFTKHRRTHTG